MIHVFFFLHRMNQQSFLAIFSWVWPWQRREPVGSRYQRLELRLTLSLPFYSICISWQMSLRRLWFGLEPAAVRVEGFDCMNVDRQNSSIHVKSRKEIDSVHKIQKYFFFPKRDKGNIKRSMVCMCICTVIKIKYFSLFRMKMCTILTSSNSRNTEFLQ